MLAFGKRAAGSWRGSQGAPAPLSPAADPLLWVLLASL